MLSLAVGAFLVGAFLGVVRPGRSLAAVPGLATLMGTVTPFGPSHGVPGEAQPAGVQRRATSARRASEASPPARAVPPPLPASHRLPAPASPAPQARAARAPVARPAPASAIRSARVAAAPTVAPRLRPDSPPSPTVPASSVQPRVAIIIDDCGASIDTVRPFLDASSAVTLAILPHLARSQEIARAAAAAHKGIMLHFPMQTITGKDPGLGTLRVDMTDEQVLDVIRRNLAAVPGVEGVNNHEGSKATADPRVMQVFLKAIRERGLYFVDSFTAPDSCAYQVASRFAMPCGRRDVFLDNDEDIDSIKDQFRLLIREAQQRGSAIGIGHARPNTAIAYVEMLPAFHEARIRLVSAREIVQRRTSPHEGAGAAGPRRKEERR